MAILMPFPSGLGVAQWNSWNSSLLKVPCSRISVPVLKRKSRLPKPLPASVWGLVSSDRLMVESAFASKQADKSAAPANVFMVIRALITHPPCYVSHGGEFMVCFMAGK
jgi:hypothetical protein